MGKDNCKRRSDHLKMTKKSKDLVKAAGTSASLFSSAIHINKFAHELNVLWGKKEESGCFLDF